jgi:diazepam-binding inhibitor (GABA receptor modulating acyl-CoA-binding protein)
LDTLCPSRQDKFNTAAEDVKKLTQRPSNEEMLEIYGLYKQATVGDNNTSQPWAVQFEASAKWNSWNGLKGTCIFSSPFQLSPITLGVTGHD